jgi:microcystin-dependent protein
MTFWKWSKSAASNAGADPTVNYAEGQAPSSLNDSARAAMAACAKYRDDMAGALTAGGTGAAYTLATNQVITSLVDRFPIAFVPNVTNTGPCTLNVDGQGAVPLRSSTGAELGAGVLLASTVYVATYFQATNEWLLHSFFVNPFNVPLGGMMPYLGASAPNANFAIPIGQAISRTTYATLFSLCGTTFGGGDGSTTFNLPDLRGRAVFGLDNPSANRITVGGGNFDGSVLGNTGGAQNHVLTTTEMPAHNHALTDPGHRHNLNGRQDMTFGAGSQTTGSGLGGSDITTKSATTGITMANAGGGSAHPIMNPAMVLPYILRII